MSIVATHEPLFRSAKRIEDLFPSEKEAALARMPDDENRWPQHILSELYRALPFLADYDVHPVIDRIDPEAGAALGYAQIRNMTASRPQDDADKVGNVIRIPIIVQDRRLQDFHVFEAGGETYPLTTERVAQAMLDPSVFDTAVTKMPGTPSLVDQLFPPYQQRQGFGRIVEPGAAGLTKISTISEFLKTGTDAGEGHTKEARWVTASPYREFGGKWLKQFEGTPLYKEALAVQVGDAKASAADARRRAARKDTYVKQASLDADMAELDASLAQWKHDHHGILHSETLSKLANWRDEGKIWSDCFHDTPLYTRALGLEKQAADLEVVRSKEALADSATYTASEGLRVKGAELEARLAQWRLEVVGADKTASVDRVGHLRRQFEKAATMLSAYKVEGSGGDAPVPEGRPSKGEAPEEERWLKAFENTPFYLEARAAFLMDQAYSGVDAKRELAEAVFKSKVKVLEAKLKLWRMQDKTASSPLRRFLDADV